MIKSLVESCAMIQGAVTCPGHERAVKILHVTGQILNFETWSGKPEQECPPGQPTPHFLQKLNRTQIEPNFLRNR
jgi:hypothetical protein